MTATLERPTAPGEPGPKRRSARKAGHKPVRTVRMPQMEDADCGAACLAIVLSGLGRRVPLREVRDRCGIGRDGVTGVALKRAAQSYGLSLTARRVHIARGLDARVRLDGVAALPVPAMVFVDMRHFAVLEGVRRDRVLINDPAVGRITMSAEEFLGRFSGIALLLEPGADFERGGPRLQFARAAAARIRPYARSVGATVAAGLLKAAPGLAASLLLRAFLTYALGLHDPAWRVPVVVGLALIAGYGMLAAAVQQRTASSATAAMSTREAGGYLWRLLRLPGTFYARRSVGGLVTRVQFNDGIAVLLAERFASAAVDAVTIVGYLAVLVWLDPLIAALALGLVTVNALTMRALARRSAPDVQQLLFDEYRRDSLAFNGLSMIETLKADAAEGWFFTRWAGLQARALVTTQRLARRSQLLLVVPGVLATLSGSLVLVVGAAQVSGGATTLATLLAAQMLVTALLLPATNLVGVAQEAQVAKAQLLMLDDVLSADADPYLTQVGSIGGIPTPDQAPEGTGGAAAGPARLAGHVEVRNLTFGYDTARPPVVDGFCLTARPGQRIAVVGATGSGKSTVAKLLTGALRAWDGEVRYDGVERESVPRELLTSSLAYVDQNLRLFEGSVADNLTLWDPTLPGDRIRAALADARVGDVVAQRGGLDAGWVAEQARNLSGGERQRLEIARALALDPSVLILDEATSALDAETEALIDAAIRSRGCTCLIIAHRLSTVRDCDEIVVLDAGRVAQRGTHEELIAVAGPYRRLIEEES